MIHHRHVRPLTSEDPRRRLDDVIATDRNLAVKVKIEGASKYRVQFIGRGGQILTEVTEPSATYSFKGDEGYVRAKVTESNGRMAWVQPVSVPNSTSSASVGWAAPLIIAGLVGFRAREFRRRRRTA